MQTSGNLWKRIGLLIALGAMVQTGGIAAARDHVEQALTAPSGAASGQARVRLRSESDGRLLLTVRGLAPNQTFDVLVGNTKVGTLHTGGGGQGSVRFRTRPRGRDLLLGFDPRGAVITIRDAAGQDVLVGNIPAGNTSARAGKIICCEPDDRGAECEDRTEAQCLERGGTVAAATSCMPNPCADVPPPGQDIICCVPDDSGAECEDRTPAECAAQGGIVVAATSCTPNPCAAVPPADPDIQCCLPDDSATECEDRTPAQCAAQGGVNMGPGDCSSNPCASIPPADPDIRCCLPDDSGAECEDRTPEQCTAQGGVNIGAGACTPDACGGVVSPTPGGYYSGGDDHGGGGQGGGGSGGSGRGGHDD
jgi:hypothetical protein